MVDIIDVFYNSTAGFIEATVGDLRVHYVGETGAG